MSEVVKNYFDDPFTGNTRNEFDNRYGASNHQGQRQRRDDGL